MNTRRSSPKFKPCRDTALVLAHIYVLQNTAIFLQTRRNLACLHRQKSLRRSELPIHSLWKPASASIAPFLCRSRSNHQPFPSRILSLALSMPLRNTARSRRTQKRPFRVAQHPSLHPQPRGRERVRPTILFVSVLIIRAATAPVHIAKPINFVSHPRITRDSSTIHPDPELSYKSDQSSSLVRPVFLSVGVVQELYCASHTRLLVQSSGWCGVRR